MVPRTRWATTVDGASIAYQDAGEGPLALVVIHGWISHLEVYWEHPRFAQFMRRLSRNLRVLQFDKRGTGMSDRIIGAPDLETRVDDVRAVMDAAGVKRAALLGWGTGGAALALYFAATHPERTIAVCSDGDILERPAPGYRWGVDEEEQERIVGELAATWGGEEGLAEFLVSQFGTGEGAHRPDAVDIAWFAKSARYSVTPTSFAAFDRLWYETDIRGILDTVHAPTAVFYKMQASDWGSYEQATYLAERLPSAELVGVDGWAPVIWIEEPEPFVSAIEGFLASVQTQEEEFNRVLVTVLFTDIVGSTDTASRVGDREWKQLAERHHVTVRGLLARYRGTELDTAGDGFYASFDGPARAVRCAQAMVKATRRLGLEIRAGLHTGEVEIIDGKPGGIAVNIGARIASNARPSEVLVSQTVKDVVAGSGLVFHDRGTHNLRGIPGVWHLHAAVNPQQPSSSSS
jgi:class 3 adenylate cyclase/pimeloyl-ACP methyl ester carboxylesterase